MGKKTERRETQVQIGTVQKRLIDLLTVSNYIGVETRVEGDGVSGGFPVRIMQCRLEVEVPFVFALNRPRPASFWYKETYIFSTLEASANSICVGLSVLCIEYWVK